MQGKGEMYLYNYNAQLPRLQDYAFTNFSGVLMRNGKLEQNGTFS